MSDQERRRLEEAAEGWRQRYNDVLLLGGTRRERIAAFQARRDALRRRVLADAATQPCERCHGPLCDPPVATTKETDGTDVADVANVAAMATDVAAAATVVAARDADAAGAAGAAAPDTAADLAVDTVADAAADGTADAHDTPRSPGNTQPHAHKFGCGTGVHAACAARCRHGCDHYCTYFEDGTAVWGPAARMLAMDAPDDGQIMAFVNQLRAREWRNIGGHG